MTVSVGSIGENVVANMGLSYVWGAGESFGTQFDGAGDLQTIVTDASEGGLYAFASTAYRF